LILYTRRIRYAERKLFSPMTCCHCCEDLLHHDGSFTKLCIYAHDIYTYSCYIYYNVYLTTHSREYAYIELLYAIDHPNDFYGPAKIFFLPTRFLYTIIWLLTLFKFVITFYSNTTFVVWFQNHLCGQLCIILIN